ncbi:MAG: MOSC domain-containing protein [Planctomycetes bacterium]|nr:MOSC domain-containing protein [Planctomycetota bacterium]MBI3847600.1 MOSC domain-containing protein [Planctomycetota bacterium]
MIPRRVSEVEATERAPIGRISSLWRHPVKSMGAESVEIAEILDGGLLGDEVGAVRIALAEPCPRCVMTTVAQADLPRDLDVLRAIARENGSHFGLYCRVIRGGLVRVGDSVRVA